MTAVGVIGALEGYSMRWADRMGPCGGRLQAVALMILLVHVAVGVFAAATIRAQSQETINERQSQLIAAQARELTEHDRRIARIEHEGYDRRLAVLEAASVEQMWLTRGVAGAMFVQVVGLVFAGLGGWVRRSAAR